MGNDWVCINAQDQFWEQGHFYMFESSIHEHAASPYLFRHFFHFCNNFSSFQHRCIAGLSLDLFFNNLLFDGIQNVIII